MISLLLCLCMVFSLLPTVVLAEGESVEPNQMSGEVCPGVTWEYDIESKTLTVSGSGLITLDDTSGNTHPWDAFKAEIEHLVIDVWYYRHRLDQSLCGVERIADCSISKYVENACNRNLCNGHSIVICRAAKDH